MSKHLKYKIGEKGQFFKYVKYKNGGKTLVVPAGTEFILTANHRAIVLDNGCYTKFKIKLGKDMKANGYDAEGLADYLTKHINRNFTLTLGELDCIRETIRGCLKDLGMDSNIKKEEVENEKVN